MTGNLPFPLTDARRAVKAASSGCAAPDRRHAGACTGQHARDAAAQGAVTRPMASEHIWQGAVIADPHHVSQQRLSATHPSWKRRSRILAHALASCIPCTVMRTRSAPTSAHAFT